MTAIEYLRLIADEIHSTVVATVDSDGLPVTCVIDMMHADENGLFFLTAKGKDFYRRLKDRGYLALSGKKGADTMHCTAVSVRGKVREIGAEMLPLLFEKIPICRKYIPPKKAVRHSRYFRYTRAAASGLTSQKSPSSGTACRSAARSSGQADTM